MDDHIGVGQVFWQSHTPPPSPFHTQEGDISKKNKVPSKDVKYQKHSQTHQENDTYIYTSM